MTTPTPHRAAEPPQSHGNLINPDHVLLFMHLCTDHVRQSGPGLVISTCSQLYATTPEETTTPVSPAHSFTSAFVATG